jgi:predicted dehydrogenase
MARSDAAHPTFAHPRIGICGGGGILGAHGPAFQKIVELCTVTVVAEPDASRAEQIRSRLHPGVRIVADHRDVLADEDVDAVDILLPHHLHMPAAIEAARAGKNVLVEKVMARNVWECDRMIEAADAAGTSLTVCHDRRYDPQWRAVKDVLDTGALGEVFFLRLNHNQNVAVPPTHWIYQADCIGGGAIMSCLTHQIDACRFYGGEVASVTCMSKSHPSRMEREFAGIVTARMRSGAIAELSINWWTDAHKDAHRNLWYEMGHVCGSGGEAYFISGRGSFVKLHDASNHDAVARYGKAALEGFVPLAPAEAGSGHDICIREWVRQLRGEPACVLTSGREARGTVEVAEAAYLSEQERRVIDLPVAPRPWPGAH